MEDLPIPTRRQAFAQPDDSTADDKVSGNIAEALTNRELNRIVIDIMKENPNLKGAALRAHVEKVVGDGDQIEGQRRIRRAQADAHVLIDRALRKIENKMRAPRLGS